MTQTYNFRDGLMVTEGVSGTWFYHISEKAKPLTSLCGRPTMVTGVPLAYWKQTPADYHVPEKWCAECERLGTAEATVQIQKGTRIHAEWSHSRMVGLAGVQMKLGATKVALTGVVRHIRGDHPTNPTAIRFFVDPDHDDGSFEKLKVELCPSCGHPHIVVRPEWVLQVLP